MTHLPDDVIERLAQTMYETRNDIKWEAASQIDQNYYWMMTQEMSCELAKTHDIVERVNQKTSAQ